MAIAADLQHEVEAIWGATLRADRRRRIEAGYLALSALVSGAFTVLGLAYIYTSLAGLR
jgi:hypothetical protein